MPLFTRKKDTAVRAFVIALLNQNCPALRDRLDGPRLEGRVSLTKPVMVVPIEGEKIMTRRAFAALTKEFSNSGVAVFVDHPFGPDDVVLGFRLGASIGWILAKAKHMHAIGGGFFQLGFRLIERLHLSDHPQLEKIVF